jgi:MFS family permease
MSASVFRSLLEAWPALRVRDYRVFIVGQAISLLGTSMQQVAMAWLAFRLSQSAYILGLVVLLGQLPAVAVAPFAGILADRRAPIRIVILTQSAALLQALILALLTLSGNINLAGIFALSVMLSIVNGFDTPARQILVAELVATRGNLGGAVVINSLVLDATRLIGTALGGWLIATAGEGTCFALNALSYLAAILALLLLRGTAKATRSAAGTRYTETFRAGIEYALRVAPIRDLILFVAFASFITTPYSVLMPIVASSVLSGGPRTLGILSASISFGAMLGAIVMSYLSNLVHLSYLPAIGAALFGGGLLMFACSHSVALSAALLALAGLGMMMLMASSNTILLMISAEGKRGLVMSLFALSYMATVPLGSFLSGAIATWLGAAATIAIGGTICLLAGLLYFSRLPSLRLALDLTE